MYVVGPLKIEPGARSVAVEGQSLKLSGLSLEMLIALAEASPNALSVDELTKRVWNRSVVSADTLSKRVSLLRAWLRDVVGDTVRIEALPSSRFRIIAMVAGSSGSEPDRAAHAIVLLRSRRAVMAVGGGVFLLAAIAVTFWITGSISASPELVSPDGQHVLTPPDT